MYSVVKTTALQGIQSMIVQVEADVCDGMPVFEMVGILSSEVKEARERIRAAIRNTGFQLPPKKVTINLCPADIRKSGTGFDLPIAMAVLAAYGLVDLEKQDRTIFVGEITLKGELRPVKGILPMVLAAKEAKFEHVIVPTENRKEAQFVKNIAIHPAGSLREVISYLNGENKLEPDLYNIEETDEFLRSDVDFSQINGQMVLKRACEVAAAGMHNILMVGPPGAGKTMAARAMASILPRLTEKEMLELTQLYSVSGMFEERKEHLYLPPFRSPHYSVTKTSLIGGGRIPKLGEISLAHKGILFLDELTEYEKTVLEQLRQPLEEREIRLVRVSGTYCYPADFMLVAAMNPCNCGYYPDKEKCTCTPGIIKQHLQKISRPLLDRIDISVEAPRVKMEELTGRFQNESSKQIRKRVEKAREIQRIRYENELFCYNSRVTVNKLEKYCKMDGQAKEKINEAYDRLDLSARAYHRVIRVARTIADLENSTMIKGVHMMEALMYRNMEECLWRDGR